MNQDFMKLAVDLSKNKMMTNEGGPFGAVIVLDGEVIGQGWNCVTSKNDPTAHAEVMAIRDACSKLGSFKLNNATLFTSCEPCPMCLSAAYWARISKIYFACSRSDAAEFNFDDEFIYNEIPKPYNERLIPIEQIHSQDAKQAFVLWDLKKDKIKY